MLELVAALTPSLLVEPHLKIITERVRPVNEYWTVWAAASFKLNIDILECVPFDLTQSFRRYCTLLWQMLKPVFGWLSGCDISSRSLPLSLAFFISVVFGWNVPWPLYLINTSSLYIFMLNWATKVTFYASKLSAVLGLIFSLSRSQNEKSQNYGMYYNSFILNPAISGSCPGQKLIKAAIHLNLSIYKSHWARLLNVSWKWK